MHAEAVEHRDTGVGSSEGVWNPGELALEIGMRADASKSTGDGWQASRKGLVGGMSILWELRRL